MSVYEFPQRPVREHDFPELRSPESQLTDPRFRNAKPLFRSQRLIPLLVCTLLVFVAATGFTLLMSASLDATNSTTIRASGGSYAGIMPSPTVTRTYFSYRDSSFNRFIPATTGENIAQGFGSLTTIVGLSLALVLAVISVLLILSGPNYTKLLTLFSSVTAIVLALTAGVISKLKERVSESAWLTPDATRSRPGLTVIVIAAIVWGLLSLGIILADLGIFGQALLMVALSSLFPISYIAYRISSTKQSPRPTLSEEAPTREIFKVERLTLDFLLSAPGIVETDPETIFDYRMKAQTYYDRVYSPMEYTLHILLNMLLVIIGLSLFFWEPPQLSPGTMTAMRYGFLGSYLFSIQLIYRRYTTADLLPAVYMYSVQNMIAGLIFNFIAFEAISNLVADQSDSIGQGAVAIIAFSLGYFPYLAIRWFNGVAHNALSASNRTEQLPLDVIDGISQFHETRLRESGLDNVANLAAANLLDLLTTTNFNSQQLVDWIDQSILYKYLDLGNIEVFRRSKIRTASDFWTQWKTLRRKSQAKDGADDARKQLALQVQTQPESLDLLYDSMLQEPNVEIVKTYLSRKAKEGELEVRVRKSISNRREVDQIKEDFLRSLHQAGVIASESQSESKQDLERLLNHTGYLDARYTELTGKKLPLPAVDDEYAQKGMDRLDRLRKEPAGDQSLEKLESASRKNGKARNQKQAKAEKPKDETPSAN